VDDPDKEVKEKAAKDAKEKADKEAAEKAAKEKEAGGASKDTAALVEEAVAKGIVAGLAGVTDNIKILVDKTVKDALGVAQGEKPVTGGTAGSVTDSAQQSDFDASFLMRGTFGVR
jgi:hypothetical protein